MKQSRASFILYKVYEDNDVTPISTFHSETPQDFKQQVMGMLTRFHGGQVDPEVGHKSIADILHTNDLSLSQLAELKQHITYNLPIGEGLGKDTLKLGAHIGSIFAGGAIGAAVGASHGPWGSVIGRTIGSTAGAMAHHLITHAGSAMKGQGQNKGQGAGDITVSGQPQPAHVLSYTNPSSPLDPTQRRGQRS